MERAGKLTKSLEDWVDEGLRLLAQQGVEAVKVERLAATLGVTKGSFYWHFGDRAALLQALLARWEAITTQAVIDRVDAEGGNAAERLTTLIRSTFQSKRGPRLDQAIRAWAARDKSARSVLQTVDAKREAYVTALLVEHGLSNGTAKVRARVLYLALIGEYAWVSHGGPPSGDEPWQELVQLVLKS
jgi:AcrR family transcriptional regulator